MQARGKKMLRRKFFFVCLVTILVILLTLSSLSEWDHFHYRLPSSWEDEVPGDSSELHGGEAANEGIGNELQKKCRYLLN